MIGIQVFFTGRISQKPELKSVGGGSEVCKFSVAVNRYAGKDKGTAADFINCSAWGATGAAIEKYLDKGDQITVMGELRSSKKDDKTYWEVNVASFEFGAKKGGGSSEPKAETEKGFSEIKPEDIPF